LPTLIQEKKLEKTALNRLSHFLDQNCDYSLNELHALLTAIISGPSLIMASEWMGFIGLSDFDFPSEKEAENIYSDIMAFYNSIAKELENGTHQPLLTINNRKHTTDEIYQANQIWAHAYMAIADWDQENWIDSSENEIAVLLLPLLTLTKLENLIEKKSNARKNSSSLDDDRKKMIAILPRTINEIYLFWFTRRKEESFTSQDSIIHRIKNSDPCFCGSGKQYRKCCLH
jgi:yecA family protein